jgi:hypothetical protein
MDFYNWLDNFEKKLTDAYETKHNVVMRSDLPKTKIFLLITPLPAINFEKTSDRFFKQGT